VYPLLSQIRSSDGRISSADPDIFADDGLEQLRECVDGESALWLPNRRRSLDLAQQMSGDLNLKRDRMGPADLNLFMTCQPIMNGIDHDDLLLRVLIGESPHRLSTRFLVDQLAVNNIVRALSTRYPMVFRYLADAKTQGLKRGYVEREGLRRYLSGFGSSSIEHREAECGTGTRLSMATAVLSIGRYTKPKEPQRLREISASGNSLGGNTLCRRLSDGLSNQTNNQFWWNY
jgi:hypothetical protein